MTKTINFKDCVGTHDILFITLDALRYDVALKALKSGRTPNLAPVLPNGTWECRHTPGSFTYAAHHAFFAGFLPTPISMQPHKRLFAAQFQGSETTGPNSFVFQNADIVSGLSDQGYHTICIGGVGFFNKRSDLGSVLPNLFHDSFWAEKFGVTEKNSTFHQVECALEQISSLSKPQRLFLFLNVSACHQPNYFYHTDAKQDSIETQMAALSYVDSQLPRLFTAFQKRAPVLLIICSDHGTAYGEDGRIGHRFAHPVIWNVPYMETVLPQQEHMEGK